MPPKTEKPPEPKKRGPVLYLAFAQLDGRWYLVANEREATSVYQLRKELVDQIGPGIGLVIIPQKQAHVVRHRRKTTTTDTFDGAVPLDVVMGPGEEAVAAHELLMQRAEEVGGMALGIPDLPPAVAAAAAEAAAAAQAAEEAARAAAVPPVDPDDDEPRDPDIDPVTGLSRRSASEARPEDEGRVIFPLDDDD